MQAVQVEAELAGQIGLQGAPTLLAQRQLACPIAFTRLRATAEIAEPTYTASPDAAFVLLVALAPAAAGEIRVNGAQGTLQPASPGDAFVFDLRTASAHFAAPYDFVRFYLPAAALQQLAADHGLGRVRGLRTTPLQVRDPVLQGLALSVLPMLEAPCAEAARFLDLVALALHAHVIRCYGAPADRRPTGPELAPWQLRRVHAFVDARLETRPSIASLAAECRLSPSYFARAFSKSTGISPHRWLIRHRVQRAKTMLLGGEELSHVALACGFVDQSHFTRTFAHLEGESPGRWRRRHCS